MQMLKKFPTLLLLISTTIIILNLSGCDSHQAEEPEHKAKLLVSRPVKQDVVISRDYVCQIHSNRHIEIKALERGYLQEVTVNEGQWVEKGQLMFKILPLTYQAELHRAQAEARTAELEYENTKTLADNNVVSATELALTKTRFERAQAEVELAAAHLSFTEIHAPFSGIMDRLLVREGSLLEEGEFLTTLSDNSRMWVYFNVPEAEYLDYMVSERSKSPQKVHILMANNKRFAHQGEIAAIEADFNNQTGTIPFRADFPNPEGLLRHGQTGNILMESPIADAVLVAQKATFEVLDQHYVYVVSEDGVVSQRRIRIREQMEDVFVIEDGLSEDDMIVLEGLRQVRDGDMIEYEYEEPELILASLKNPAE